jgi:hypothetical protein
MNIKYKNYFKAIMLSMLLGSCGSIYTYPNTNYNDTKVEEFISESVKKDIKYYLNSGKLKKKKSAKLDNIDSNIVKVIPIIINVYKNAVGDMYVPVITSGNDSRHRHNSLHYENKAIDIRTTTSKHINWWKAKRIANKLKKELPIQYKVILENDHIHLSYND